MKLLMTTRASAAVVAYSQISHPILIKYAKKWGAEFMILDQIRPHDSGGRRLMKLYGLLDEYDRIVHIDTDIIINKTCPNMFEVVPSDTVGLVFEDKGSRLKNRRAQIAHIKRVWGGNEDWVSGYFNSAVFVVSRMHKEIFTEINGKFWGEDFKVQGADQTHFSYQLYKQGHKYIDLGFKFNHSHMFSERWNGSLSRFDSYIIHYGGNAHFPDRGNRSRSQLMKDDAKKIWGEEK